MPRLSKARQQEIRELFLTTEKTLDEIRYEVGLPKNSKQVEKFIEEEGLEALKNKVEKKVKEEVAEAAPAKQDSVDDFDQGVLDMLTKIGLKENDAKNALRRAKESMEKAGNTDATQQETFQVACSFTPHSSLMNTTTDTGKSGVAVMTPAAAQASSGQAAPRDPNASRHLKDAHIKPKDV